MTRSSSATLDADAAPDRPARAATFALCALVAIAPLWLGGARWDHQVQLAAFSALVLALTGWAHLGVRMRFPWPLWAPALVAGFTLLQLVPLPPGLLGLLSPEAAELRAYSLVDLGLATAETWHPMSVDPALGTIASVHQCAFVAVAWAAANVSSGQRSLVERALLFGATATAVVGFIHWALGAEHILGTWGPAGSLRLSGYFSTFVNNNTLAGLLVLGTLAGLGLAVETGSVRRQRIAGVSAAVCGVGVFASASRGGQVALVVALALFCAFTLLPQPDGRPDGSRARARRVGAAGLAMVVAGLCLSVMLLPDWGATAWSAPETDSKFAAWPGAWAHAEAYPWTGSGRGTFRVAHPSFQGVKVSQTLGNPENIVLQLTTELGFIVGAVALLGGLAAWGLALRAGLQRGRPRQWALLAGLGGVGLQQCVDFGFESAGLSLPVAAALGVLLARSRSRRAPPASPLRRRLSGPLALAAAAVVGAYVALAAPRALAHLPDDALADIAQRPASLEALESAGREAVSHHPADPWIPLRVASRLAQLDPPPVPRVLRWLNRAIRLAPRNGESHLLAARMLGAGPTAPQAAQEYARALALMPWRRNTLVREVVQRLRDPDLLVRAMPEAPEFRRALTTLLTEGPRPKLARETLLRAVERWPDDADLRYALGLLCVEARDLSCVTDEIDALEQSGHTLRAAILEARSALVEGDREAARAVLVGAFALGARDREFLLAAVDLNRRLGDLVAARAHLDAAWPLVALDAPAAAQALALRGRVELELGDPRHAVTAFAQAYDHLPKPVFARGAVEAARRAGDDTLAASTVARARADFPDFDSPRGAPTSGAATPPSALAD